MTQAATMGVPWMLDMLVGAVLLAAAYLKGLRCRVCMIGLQIPGRFMTVQDG